MIGRVRLPESSRELEAPESFDIHGGACLRGVEVATSQIGANHAVGRNRFGSNTGRFHASTGPLRVQYFTWSPRARSCHSGWTSVALGRPPLSRRSQEYPAAPVTAHLHQPRPDLLQGGAAIVTAIVAARLPSGTRSAPPRIRLSDFRIACAPAHQAGGRTHTPYTWAAAPATPAILRPNVMVTSVRDSVRPRKGPKSRCVPTRFPRLV